VSKVRGSARIESFHAILEDECYSRHEFQDFEDVLLAIIWITTITGAGKG